jgi:tetratricopeptide (TPR) repeat protein
MAIEPRDPEDAPANDGRRRMTSINSVQRLADSHLVHGRIEQALERYRKAVTLTTNGREAADSRSILGDAYVFADQTISALRQYRRAIRHSPRRAAPHFSLAELYRRYGKLQAALLEYRAAVECDPQNAFYHYRLGDALADGGYIPAAIGELETACELAATDGFYHFWLSDLYLMVGMLEDAIREMQQAAIFAPNDDYYNMRLAVLYLLSGHPTDAATSLAQALRLSPGNAIYECLLADIYCHTLSNNNMAMKHYQRAGDMDAYDREHVRRLRELTTMDTAVPTEGGSGEI